MIVKCRNQIVEVLHTTGMKPKHLLYLTYLFWGYNRKLSVSQIESNAEIFIRNINNGILSLSELIKQSDLNEEVYNHLIEYMPQRYQLLSKAVLDFLSMLDDDKYSYSMIFLNEIIDRECRETQLTKDVSKFIAWLLSKDIDDNAYTFSFLGSNSTILQKLIETRKINHFTCFESNYDEVLRRKIMFNYNNISDYLIEMYSIYEDINTTFPLEIDIVFSQFPWLMKLTKEDRNKPFFYASTYPDFTFMKNLAGTLSLKGKAITLIHDSLFRLKKYTKDRKQLIESGFLESVISLPKGSVIGYSGNPYLVILSKSNNKIDCYDFTKLSIRDLENRLQNEFIAGNDETYKAIDLKELINTEYRIDISRLFKKDTEGNYVI